MLGIERRGGGGAPTIRLGISWRAPSTSGINGLDRGVAEVDRLYCLWMVQGPRGGGAVRTFISTK